ncbi:MAG: orotidine-5'-phosphate decarboxylase [Gemmatimonadaceae bacterium]|nr:orotidine-5'-phosphate decarboxylase [Gemmatimonadaceae bacterium]
MAVIPIVALDSRTAGEAAGLVGRLGDSCSFYKVGSELFTAAGPAFVESLIAAGKRVFLDLKFHDIPNTVAGGVRSASDLGASMVTVHASGGIAMLRAAVESAAEAGSTCEIFAVTVLTSLDDTSLGAATGRPDVDVMREVERLAQVAHAAQVNGVVCSGREAHMIRMKHGTDLRLLIPGIRLAGDAASDQARTVTPDEAARAGANYIVVGRSVTRAADPLAAMGTVTAALGKSA